MNNYGVNLMLLATLMLTSRAGGAQTSLSPAFASRPGAPSVTLKNVPTDSEPINLTLSDAIYLRLRDINAVRDIGVRWRQFEIAQRARDLSKRKLDIEREKLSVGRSNNVQVLSFENDLRNAENARLNAQISYLSAQAELDQTLGTTLESWDISLDD